MIHKTIVVTIGLALVLIAVISAVPMQQMVYAAGSPGVGSVGGSGSGNPFSGGGSLAGLPGGVFSPGTGGVGGSASAGSGSGGGPGSTNNILPCSLVSCGGSGTGFGGPGNGGAPGLPGQQGKTGTPGQPGQTG